VEYRLPAEPRRYIAGKTGGLPAIIILDILPGMENGLP
jgi:hypothetical protein